VSDRIDPERADGIMDRVGRGGQYGDHEGHRPDVAPPDAGDDIEDDDAPEDQRAVASGRSLSRSLVCFQEEEGRDVPT